jgi:hypothetical protein
MRAFCRHIAIVSISLIFPFATALIASVSPSTPAAAGGGGMTLQGNIKSGENGLPGYHVSLYGAFIQTGPAWMLLGSGDTDGAGHFSITYSISPDLLTDDQPLLFVEAQNGPSMLASCIGPAESAPNNIVVNERTTVATANTFAQFVGAQSVQGNFYGMKNAAQMLKNLADPATGFAGIVVSSTPNGSHTSTYATFNSLANVVTACVSAPASCSALFTATTPPGQPAPANVLQALANLVKYPSYPGYPTDNLDPIFVLSQVDPIYAPPLPHRPTSWLLFLKITGGFYDEQNSDNLMNGPASFAIDKEGFVWFDTNYFPQAPDHFACASNRAIKMSPSGQPVANTPFLDGGLSGQGWGVAIDANDNTWIANFGFQDPPCFFLPQRAPHNSVSLFAPDGTPISPATGYTDGNLSWPMGIVADRTGNIWIASCGNDTVTRYAGGDHTQPLTIALGASVSPKNPQEKPFGLASDLAGNIWVTKNRSSTVSILSPDGRVLKTIPSVYQGKTIFTHPIGNAADSRGNIWVANSDWLDAPCPTRRDLGMAQNPSATLLMADTQQPNPGSPFSGGGITLPWGIAVDGNDTVWVFNFGVIPPQPSGQSDGVPPPTGIARLCGADTSKCPVPGMHTGDPISPSTGYRSDAFMRITAGQIDSSGNIWITDNWKIDVNPFKNPGGNAIVIAIGAAGPIQTPLIGPPVPF